MTDHSSDPDGAKPHDLGLAPRRAAAFALNAALNKRAMLDAALERAPGFSALSPADRGLARALAATALRRKGQSEAVLNVVLDRPLDKAPPAARIILLLGATQILWMKTPPHAAVSTSVDLAAESAPAGKLKGLINAVLRRLTREGEALAREQPPILNLPEWLRQSWREAYGEERLAAIAETLTREPVLDLTLKLEAEIEDWASRLGAQRLQTGSLRLDRIGDVAALPGYQDGAWWAQDAAAALPARLLRPQAGERIADLCAAPGGKTMQLAASGADVTALDLSEKRLKRLRENLARTGLTARLEAGDVRQWRPGQAFDAILLDAPCSATGTLRRHPESAWIKTIEDVERLASVQRELGLAAADMLKPGGRMVICTCSLQPEEGEDWLEDLLTAREDLQIDPAAPQEIPGLADAITPQGAVRLTPDMLAEAGGLDGFFFARLKRRG